MACPRFCLAIWLACALLTARHARGDAAPVPLPPVDSPGQITAPRLLPAETAPRTVDADLAYWLQGGNTSAGRLATTAAVAPSVEPASFTTAAARASQPPEATPWLADRMARLEKRLDDLASAEKKGGDGKTPTVKWTGQLQGDHVMISQSPNNIATLGDIQNFADLRRARIGAQGEVFDNMVYRMEMDFALTGKPTFLDVYFEQQDLPYLRDLRVGYFFEPFGLERYTSNRFTTFMERSLPDVFNPARHLGVMILRTESDQMGTYFLGTFRSFTDPWGGDFGDPSSQAVTGRVTRLLWYDEPSGGRYLLHVGGAFSYRGAGGRSVRFQSRPEIRPGDPAVIPFPPFVDTGNIPTEHWELYGTELMLIHGPFSIQSEAMLVPLNQAAGPRTLFYGWYAFASFFLTGENRGYSRETGISDRVYPFENFFRVRGGGPIITGTGAWEVAIRLSQIDLTDAGILGGRLTDLTVGLNWYLNPWAKMTFNYVHPMLQSGTHGPSTADIFGIRAQFDFGPPRR
ncbi:MAG: hypothetical protein K2Y37_06145 [Pirellulales bacterium]|nr:hypothetical protein [Pirellulales bacterium]